jgi:hypothetical protein
VRGAALALAVLLMLAPATAAHDFWIQPDSYRPVLGERMAVRLMVGQRGEGEAVARQEERIVRFAALAPEASAELPIVGQDGQDPAGWLRPTAGGPLVLVYTNTPSRIELDGEKFEAYLREEGLDAIAKLRVEKGESGKPARELYSRCAKALVEVPGGEGGMSSVATANLFARPVGLRLEIVPEVNPIELGAAPRQEGESDIPLAPRALPALPLRVLLDGQPLADALVRAVLLEADEPPDVLPMPARTDAEGRCRITLPSTGRWLIATVDMREAAADSNADYESVWASLTFEVPRGR